MNFFVRASLLAFVGCVASFAPSTSNALPQLPTTTVNGCAGGVYSTTDGGTPVCYSDGGSGGSYGGGGGGTTVPEAGGGGGTSSTTLVGVTIPVPGVPGAFMNASATKIKNNNCSLSDDENVRINAVKAAEAVYPNSEKNPGSKVTVYYFTGETEVWVKVETGTSSVAWQPQSLIH